MDNLDNDTRLAMAFGYGVHYGRFKADYPNTREKEILIPKKVETAKCLWCGSEFPATKRGRRFCKEQCAHNYYTARRRAGEPPDPDKIRRKNCKICGKEMIRQRNRTYCSPECQEAARQRSYERAARKKLERQQEK